MSPLIAAAVLLAAPEPPPDVKPSMHDALVAVLELQPYLARPDLFRAPENQAQLQGAMATLATVRHGFLQPRGTMTSTGAMATLFARQVELASAELAAKNDEAARLRLGGVTQLCLNCHLRRQAKTDFFTAARLVDRLAVTDLERARLYAATRQLDPAFALWRKALVTPPQSEVEAFEQTEALRLALTVAVRGKDDPSLAIALLEPQLNRKELPGFVRRTTLQWLMAAHAWSRERFNLAGATSEQLMAKAHELVGKTPALTLAARDDVHLVELSRASAALDEALRLSPDGPHRAEALYLLGVTSATVDPPVAWQLEWVYLEACIRENAPAPIARQCLERLKERTWLAYQPGRSPAAVYGALAELSGLLR